MKFDLRQLCFMSPSLESLVNNVRSFLNDVNKLTKIYKNTTDEFKNDEQFLLMIQKGVHPYDYINKFY